MPAGSFAAVYVTLLVASFELARRSRLLPADVSRKLVLAGIAAFGIVSVALYGGRGATGTYAVIAVLAYLSFRLDLLASVEDDGASLGTVLLPATAALLFQVFGPERAYVAAAAVACAGVGDAAAGIVGRRMGTRRFRNLVNARSMEGTLAMFLAGGITVAPVLALLGPLGWHQAVAFALITATLAAVTEASSPASLDNAIVPGVAALVLTGLLSFSQ